MKISIGQIPESSARITYTELCETVEDGTVFVEDSIHYVLLGKIGVSHKRWAITLLNCLDNRIVTTFVFTQNPRSNIPLLKLLPELEVNLQATFKQKMTVTETSPTNDDDDDDMDDSDW